MMYPMQGFWYLATTRPLRTQTHFKIYGIWGLLFKEISTTYGITNFPA